MASAPRSVTPSPFKLPSDLPPLPFVPETDPSRCVLDAFRIAIAKLVAEALPPLTVEQVYGGVDYGKKGVDFTIALPRFRLPGKVDELAGKVLALVSLLASIAFRIWDVIVIRRCRVFGLMAFMENLASRNDRVRVILARKLVVYSYIPAICHH